MKKFDYLLVFVAIIATAVILFAVTGRNKSFSSTPVEAIKTINFDVAIKGATVTQTTPLFVKGEKTFLTIRNVPYQDLLIKNVQQNAKQTVLAMPAVKEKYIVVDDASSPNQYDFIITIEDTAKITADGPVVGGNKIKIGIPVVLEGPNYKLSGTVSSLTILDSVE